MANSVRKSCRSLFKRLDSEYVRARCLPYSRRELVDGAVVCSAAVNGGAVEISESIDDHTVVGKATIWRTRKLMNHALCPLTASRTEHEDHATSQAALTRGSIQIASRVGNKIADRTVAIVSALKAVNHSLAPFASGPGGQLVNSADTVSATVVSGPKKISPKHHKARHGKRNVRPVALGRNRAS